MKKPMVCLDGSYTIEASVIMSLFTALFLVIVYEAFFLHDRNIYADTAVYYITVLEMMSREPVAENGELNTEKLGKRRLFVSDYLSEADAGKYTELFRRKAESRSLASVTDRVEIAITSSEIVIDYEAHTDFPGSRLVKRMVPGIGYFQGTIKQKLNFTPEEIVRAKKGLFGGKT